MSFLTGFRGSSWMIWLLVLGACSARIIPSPSAEPAPAPSEIEASLFLIGDAGAPDARREPVLRALTAALATAPDSTVVLFLGDNVYPLGLVDSSSRLRGDSERRLHAQIDAALVRSVRPVFLPGNHDWHKSGADGWNAIRRQAREIARYSEGRAVMLPVDGCPGPAITDLGRHLRLVLLDSEWWLTPHAKPGRGSGCPAETKPAVLAQLSSAIAGRDGRQVVVAAHHPLASGGPHGGYFPLEDHLFPLRKLHPALLIPLPIIGSAYPIARGAGISAEDLGGSANVRFRHGLDSVFALQPPLLYASGHEHALQIIDRGRPPLLAVSGAGIYGQTSFVHGIEGTRLALSRAGFMRLDLLRDGRTRLAVVLVEQDGVGREVYAAWLESIGGGSED